MERAQIFAKKSFVESKTLGISGSLSEMEQRKLQGTQCLNSLRSPTAAQ